MTALAAGCGEDGKDISASFVKRPPVPAETNVFAAVAGHVRQEKACFVREIGNEFIADGKTVDEQGLDWNGCDGSPKEPEPLIPIFAYASSYDDAKKTFSLPALSEETKANGRVAGQTLTVLSLSKEEAIPGSPVRRCTREERAGFTDTTHIAGVRSVWHKRDDLQTFLSTDWIRTKDVLDPFRSRQRADKFSQP